MGSSSFVIAIDGPAASGKGTLARRLAGHYDFAYLDTGLLYRAVGLSLISSGFDPEDAVRASEAARALTPVDLQSDGLRCDSVAVAASKVAAISSVREALLAFQRSFAANPPHGATGAVLDGRDIGTIVCPKAAVKLFISANIETRAARRVRELRERGLEAIHSVVLADMLDRDRRDSTRGSAPLTVAKGAMVIDTSVLDPDAVFSVAVDIVEKKLVALERGAAS